MCEVLTMAEIEERYDGEWVLVGDPDLDDALRVKSGEVLCHSTDRDEVYRKAVELRPKHAAFLYLGSIPDGTVVVL